MPICKIHGRYDDYCFECRKEHEYAENDRMELLAQLESLKDANDELAVKLTHPGDFECPHCRYRTLRRSASRCVKCHGVIEDSFWIEITERERREEEAAEMKRKEAEAIRHRAALEAKIERDKTERVKRKKQELWAETINELGGVFSFWLCVFAAIAGIVWLIVSVFRQFG